MERILLLLDPLVTFRGDDGEDDGIVDVVFPFRLWGLVRSLSTVISLVNLFFRRLAASLEPIVVYSVSNSFSLFTDLNHTCR